jgi:hypothetical protein
MEWIVVFGILITGALIFYMRIRTPVVYALRVEELDEFDDGIIVCRSAKSAVGWCIVGDADGVTMEDGIPVRLSGVTPPEEIGGMNLLNRYFCVAAYLDTEDPEEGEASVDRFYVSAWYPLYPVRRDSIFPDSLLSKEYFSLFDQKPYWPFGTKKWRRNIEAEGEPQLR